MNEFILYERSEFMNSKQITLTFRFLVSVLGFCFFWAKPKERQKKRRSLLIRKQFPLSEFATRANIILIFTLLV